MDDVNVKPSDLRDFASHLQNISQQLADIKKSTDSKLSNLQFKDAGRIKFEERYHNGIRPVNDLVATCEEFIGYLYKKADLIEQAGNY